MRKRVMVVGFLFKQVNPSKPLAYDNAAVLLVKKTKPQWQAGMFNGPGGCVEIGEEPVNAMVREMREECGIDVPAAMWTNIICFEGADFKVECYAARMPPGALHICPKTPADAEALGLEYHSWVLVPGLASFAHIVPDVRWLVPLCLDGRFESGLLFVKDDAQHNPEKPSKRPVIGGKETDTVTVPCDVKVNGEKVASGTATAHRDILGGGRVNSVSEFGQVAASFPPFVPVLDDAARATLGLSEEEAAKNPPAATFSDTVAESLKENAALLDKLNERERLERKDKRE